MTKRLVYITVAAPYSCSEQFLVAEMKMLKRLGTRLMVIPRSPNSGIVHREDVDLARDALVTTILSLRVLAGFVFCFVRRPHICVTVIVTVLKQSRNWEIAAKNAVVLPKAFFISTIVDEGSVSHIHAGWGSTPATIAWVLSRLTGIPWSMTLHRGDIVDDNLLKLKVEDAAFVRCISEGGRKLLDGLIGSSTGHKVRVLHLGAEYDPTYTSNTPMSTPFVIVSAANLYPVKGLAYLIEACSILKSRGAGEFECRIYGEGPLRTELLSKIHDMGLDGVVSLRGAIPHAALLGIYRDGQAGAFVLPSINTSDGQHEGIPVALMEAMSYGVPVISTDTGAIGELVGGGAGILVREKDSEILADAIELLMHDSGCRRELSEKGRAVIAERFNLQTNTRVFAHMLGGR